jgi:PD-(D/E)XK endonuclease
VQHPKEIGDRTTLAVMLGLHTAGFSVLLPFGENARYDLVIDDGTPLSRIQCKTGRLRSGAIRFNTASSYEHHRSSPQPRRSYHGEIEYFAVHCSDTGGVYLVPIEVPTYCDASLRVKPARNSQRRRVRFAEDYEITRVRVSPSLGRDERWLASDVE